MLVNALSLKGADDSYSEEHWRVWFWSRGAVVMPWELDGYPMLGLVLASVPIFDIWLLDKEDYILSHGENSVTQWLACKLKNLFARWITELLKEIVHLWRNVVIDFDITVFDCVIKNKHLPSLFCFILL